MKQMATGIVEMLSAGSSISRRIESAKNAESLLRTFLYFGMFLHCQNLSRKRKKRRRRRANPPKRVNPSETVARIVCKVKKVKILRRTSSRMRGQVPDQALGHRLQVSSMISETVLMTTSKSILVKVPLFLLQLAPKSLLRNLWLTTMIMKQKSQNPLNLKTAQR